MKIHPFVIVLAVFVGFASLPLVLLNGCGVGGDKKAVRFLGQWPGQFTVEKVNVGPDGVDDRKHHSLHGYVSVRLDRSKYIMHLEGEQQQIDITGKWAISDSQITLSPVDIKVNTEGGKDGVNPNRKYIPDEDLYVAYGKKITLKLSKDGSTLEGLRTTIAFLEGTHTFKKE
jgi:hypothetical protein